MQARRPAHLASISWFHKSLKSCVSLFRWQTRTSFRHCTYLQFPTESHVGQNTAQWSIPCFPSTCDLFFGLSPKIRSPRKNNLADQNSPEDILRGTTILLGKKGRLLKRQPGRIVSKTSKQALRYFGTCMDVFTWKSTKIMGKWIMEDQFFGSRGHTCSWLTYRLISSTCGSAQIKVNMCKLQGRWAEFNFERCHWA